MKTGRKVWGLSVPGQVRIPQGVATKTIHLFFHQNFTKIFIWSKTFYWHYHAKESNLREKNYLLKVSGLMSDTTFLIYLIFTRVLLSVNVNCGLYCIYFELGPSAENESQNNFCNLSSLWLCLFHTRCILQS